MLFSPRLALLASFLLLLAATLISATTQAASIETLVMPGELTSDHAELETECGNCHTSFKRDSQRGLCLDCHEEIAADIDQLEGFHGRHSEASVDECRTCHTEHKGRDADTTGLVPETFDHSFTDFPLEGQHSSTDCASCHDDFERYRETPGTCAACHSDDDPHKGNLGEVCSDCHQSAGWLEVAFDHDESTEFPLTGAHTTVVCSSCHINQIYEGTAASCHGCHSLDDVHNGKRGELCADCHSTQDWKTKAFDHASETGFELQGKHADLQCANCHLTDMALEQPPTNCAGCHSTNDPHLGRNGSECADCHSQNAWSAKFDHLNVTGFELKGEHGELACNQCHEGELTDALPTDCKSCHAAADPHGRKLPECEKCHGEQGWLQNISFHHDLTKFSLVGAHKLTSCEQCHNGLLFAENRGSLCIDCHRENDVHEQSMGEDCAQCHSPADWAYWQFDHDKQTDYPLTGAHEGLSCEGCHTLGRSTTPSSNCQSCHRQDDVHRGSFGSNCQRCHSTDTFSGASMGRIR